jgi:hypothetical protein
MVEMKAPWTPNALLEAHHLYLWPRIELATDAGVLSYDFMTTGLLY